MTDTREQTPTRGFDGGSRGSGGSRGLGAGLLSGQGFSFAIMAVFFLVMMLALVAGVAIYRGVAAERDAADRLRMESGLITNLVRMGDMADAIAVGVGPEGDALVLSTTLSTGTYETRIYHCNGAIVQEYAFAGLPYDPELAVRVVESRTFAFTFADGLLTITTDDGDFCVALRSVQGANAISGNGGGA